VKASVAWFPLLLWAVGLAALGLPALLRPDAGLHGVQWAVAGLWLLAVAGIAFNLRRQRTRFGSDVGLGAAVALAWLSPFGVATAWSIAFLVASIACTVAGHALLRLAVSAAHTHKDSHVLRYGFLRVLRVIALTTLLAWGLSLVPLWVAAAISNRWPGSLDAGSPALFGVFSWFLVALLTAFSVGRLAFYPSDMERAKTPQATLSDGKTAEGG
jgi:hypothetical protein